MYFARHTTFKKSKLWNKNSFQKLKVIFAQLGELTNGWQ
jgi:hypothetical protein